MKVSVLNSVGIIVLMIALLGCDLTPDNEDAVGLAKPEHFLSKELLIDAMVDFRIAEASIRQMASKGENTRKITPYYYKPLLQKYDITIEDYYSNLTYYSHEPDVMDEIYKEVVNRLIEKQTKVRSQ